MSIRGVPDGSRSPRILTDSFFDDGGKNLVYITHAFYEKLDHFASGFILYSLYNVVML